MFDAIEMVSEESKPTTEQIDFCVKNGLYDMDVNKQSVGDWYCLLRKIQGDLLALKGLVNSTGKAYMIDNSGFIKDSLFCEYAYIINLDTHMLEFWVGFQKKPQADNRYGQEEDRGYYPCKLAYEFPLSEMEDAEAIIDKMKSRAGYSLWVKDIEWDFDEDEDENVPTSEWVPIEEILHDGEEFADEVDRSELEERAINYLTEKYGWCIRGVGEIE